MKPQTIALLMLSALIIAPAHAEDTFTLSRTASGKPDLTGFYDSATLTPLNRPERFGST